MISSFILSTILYLSIVPRARGFIAPNSLATHHVHSKLSETKLSASPSDSDVIEAAKKLMQNAGYFNQMDESLFAEDFIFRGPVIGPLNKEDYTEVLEYFSIYKAFPDIDPNCFGFSLDPDEPLRVWFQVRASGTYTKPLGGPFGKLIKPDGQKYRGSTETWSLLFDENLKARLMTAGYVSDRFDSGSTTDGIGLSFGILKTIGLSIPSGVGNPILQLIQTTNPPLSSLRITPKAMSDPEKFQSGGQIKSVELNFKSSKHVLILIINNPSIYENLTM